MLSRVSRLWRLRRLPASLTALRNCRISYSQFGEDLFISSLLGNERRRGFYVDVGCFHPIRYSNTYKLYKRGWRGVCIDANPLWAADWARFRPDDRFIPAAVAPSSGRYWYVIDNQYPAMNRLVPFETRNDQELGEPRYRKVAVDAAPLNSVLADAGTPSGIDLLNIDCEGLDAAILEPFEFTKYRPRVICIEDHDAKPLSLITSFLEARHYQLRAMIGISKVFSLS